MSKFDNISTEEKKMLKKMFISSFVMEHSYNYERQQGLGFSLGMWPVIKKVYKTKEEQKKAMQTYTAFFNTEPQVGSVVVGITASLEEAKANGADDINAETINGLRAGLMGPLAGIGDSLVVGTLIPILLGIAMGLSTGGSPIGAIFYIIVWNLLITWGMRFLYFKGYELGGKAIDFLVGERATAIRESIVMLGTIVIGAVAGTWINIRTGFTMTAEGADKPFLVLQDTLNGVFPNILSAVFVIFCWYLLTKRNMSPIYVMLLLVVIAFVGVLVGFFDTGLTY